MSSPCTDHLGHRHPSEREMCKDYGVNYQTYKTRKGKGWATEECLLGR